MKVLPVRVRTSRTRVAAVAIGSGLALILSAPVALAAGTESNPPTIPTASVAPLKLGATPANTKAPSADVTPTTIASAGAAYEKGKALIAANDFAGAIAALEDADRLQPNNADVNNLLGYSNRKAGRLDKALAHYAIALKIDPNHKGAHEYLGEAYLVLKKPAKAKVELASLAKICGTSCAEYVDLKNAIASYSSKKPGSSSYK